MTPVCEEEHTAAYKNKELECSESQWVSVADVLGLVLRAMASQKVARGGRSYKPRHSQRQVKSVWGVGSRGVDGYLQTLRCGKLTGSRVSKEYLM
jgi:hypothetical protein